MRIARGPLLGRLALLAGVLRAGQASAASSAEERLGACRPELVSQVFDPAGPPSKTEAQVPELRALVVRFAGPDEPAQQFGMAVGSSLRDALQSYAEQSLDLEKSGLTARNLRVKYVACVLADHDQARAIGQAAGADVVLWGQTFCDWRKPKQCQQVDLHLEGANSNNTLAHSPGAVMINKVQVQVRAARVPEPESVYKTSLTVVRWVGLEAAAQWGEPVRRPIELTRADLPRLASPQPKLLLDFVLGLYAFRAGRFGLAAQLFQRSQQRVSAGVEGVGDLYRMIGESYVRAGQPKVGQATLQRAFDACDREDARCRAETLTSLLWAEQRDERIISIDAQARYEEALKLFEKLRDPAGQARVLTRLGAMSLQHHAISAALAYYQQAAPLVGQANNRAVLANHCNGLALAYGANGSYDKAIESHLLALQLTRQDGDRLGEAETLDGLGVAYSQSGDKAAALKHYQQALTLFRQTGDIAKIRNALGHAIQLLDSMGRVDDAAALLPEAVALSMKLAPEERDQIRNLLAARFLAALRGKQWQVARHTLEAMKPVKKDEHMMEIMEAVLLGQSDAPEAAAAYRRLAPAIPKLRADGSTDAAAMLQAGETRVRNRKHWPDCNGTVITRVWADSRAARLGLQAGDILVRYNGACLFDSKDLQAAQEKAAPQDKLSLEIWQGSRLKTLEVSGGPLSLGIEVSTF